MKIILSPNPYRDRGLKTAQAADRILKEVGVETCFCLPFEPDPHFELPKNLIYADIDSEISDADLLICFGGDGTLLHAAKLSYSYGVPIMGVNMGSVGFMAELEHSELKQLARLAKGDFKIEQRMMLDVSLIHERREIYFEHALNDAAITKGAVARVVEMSVSADGELISSLSGDGVLVSTPTGSTAYSLSVGGPIMVPHSNTVVITPVAPHSLNVRPIVIRDDWEITLDVESRSHNFLVAIDGRSETCKETTQLTIRRADYSVKVVKRFNHIFFDTLRSKMMWGADGRR